MSPAARISRPDVDWKDQTLLANPYPWYADSRRAAPVHHVRTETGYEMWRCFRYDDILEMLRSSNSQTMGFPPEIVDTFLDQPASPLYALARVVSSVMLIKNGKDHSRLRSLAAKALSPRMVEKLRPRIAVIVDELLRDIVPRGEMDLLADFGVPLPIITDDYREETSDAFELGFKSTFMDGRFLLNGAYYNTQVDDMQFFEFFVGPFGLLRVVSNMDEVDISGFELDASWRATENLRLYVGANVTDSEIKANTSRPDTVGNEAPYTPEYTVNVGGDINFPLSNGMNMFARVDAQWVGETWFHTVQVGERPTIFMPLFEDNFGAGAGALGTAEYSNALRNEYSTVNLRVGLQGEKWTVTAFVLNLTDEKYLEEVIPAPEFGGVFNHPGTQRRAGLEVSFRF